LKWLVCRQIPDTAPIDVSIYGGLASLVTTA